MLKKPDEEKPSVNLKYNLELVRHIHDYGMYNGTLGSSENDTYFTPVLTDTEEKVIIKECWSLPIGAVGFVTAQDAAEATKYALNLMQYKINIINRKGATNYEKN